MIDWHMGVIYNELIIGWFVLDHQYSCRTRMLLMQKRKENTEQNDDGTREWIL